MNNNNPLVSIVVPAYNHAELLKKAIQSVIVQEYTNWEMIIVDNHSTDNTAEVINGFNESRIRHVKIQNNGVVAVSRNEGIKSAKGEFIAFLDADDWWSPQKLSVSMNYLSKTGTDLVYHDLWFVENSQSPFKKKIKARILNKPVFRDLMLRGNTVINSSVVICKEKLFSAGLLDESRELIASEDYDLWLRVALETDGFVKIPQCLGFYWYGGDNLSKNRNLSKAGRIILNKHKGRLTNKEFPQAEGYLFYLTAMYFKTEKRYKEARRYFLQSFVMAVGLIKMKALYRFIKLLGK